jgi:hypothetical protein
VIRHCADCQAPYSVEPEEEDWFRREGMTLPKRCPRCRSARKGLKNQFRTCQRCGKTFPYTRELQLYARTYGWGPPRHCVGGCVGHEGAAESDEERAMRELLEQLRDRRVRVDAPPIEAVLEARRKQPRPAPAGPTPDSLFRGLGEDEGPGDAEAQLADEVDRHRGSGPSAGELFASLGAEPASRRKGKRKKRRPRPRDDAE